MLRFTINILILLTLLLIGCTPDAHTLTSVITKTDIPTALVPTVTSSITKTLLPITLQPEKNPKFGYTHQNSDGNRFLEGQGQLPDSLVIDVELSGTPEWVVAVPYEDISLWAVVLQDGRVEAFWVSAEGAEGAQITPNQLPKESVPLLRIDGNNASLVRASSFDQSRISHPIELEQHKIRAFIQTDGSLVLKDLNDKIIAELKVNALPDARIISDGASRLIVLTDPSDIYTHGVLGDQLEATSITIVELFPEPHVVRKIPIANERVIEGIAPIWIDWNLDGELEIIVTLSDALEGAQLAVFNANGDMIGSSSAIGQGYRWRHQIAVAPFGPNDEWELVDVLTPHIGGVIEFFQWQNNKLEKVAQLSGYTSHVIGTRNLDMATAGDFDSDGHVELILPNQELTELGAIQRTAQGAEVAWSLQIDGQISTNIGALNLANGKIALAIGRSDGTLRIWYPP